VIEAGVDMVDISFLEQDPFELDELARGRGVVAVVDCGIAPGWSNLVAGHMEAVLDRVDRFVCYVGGLPTLRRWPYEYRAVFSPIDVIAEYTRPARMILNGREVTRSALSGVELLDLPGVGTLEAFNSDGLRTLLHTLQIPLMKEKTMRYPGHAERMRMLRETGFFGEEPIDVRGVPIRPIDLTARLLFPAWQLGEHEEDLTVMRVEVEGELDGRAHRRTYELLDRFDRETGVTSMARTTGYTCTAVVDVLSRGMYTQPGVAPPEYLGRTEGVFEAVNTYLAERGVEFTVRDDVGG
jgi:saccharopine dehydrogenase-like NADP-dependent oxidoreductase